MTDPATLVSRKNALTLFQAGITAADPCRSVQRYLSASGDHIGILLNDGLQKRTSKWSSVHLIAFGKAACAMMEATLTVIPAHLLAGQGIAVTNYENVRAIDNVEVIGAGHPLPDAAGFNAAQKCAERIQSARQGELVLVLISGGGSALLPYPVEPVTLQEKIATTDLLLASGATINQINCVRKHLSQLKGGGLAKMAFPADVHALILSDVLGDDVSAIASGPTVPDATTFSEALDVVKSKNILDKVPANVLNYLELGRLSKAPETPKPGDSLFNNSAYTLIGSNALSVDATLQAAEALGYDARIYSHQLCGESREVAENWVRHALAVVDKGIDKPLALLAGGETTVTLKGKGRGGRNQEMALAFAIAAKRQGLAGRWTFLSGGTDGRDGPTDAAGGLVDQDTLERLINAGCDPAAMLADNDSYNALKSSQDLIDTGATGTNVADLQILLLYPHTLRNMHKITSTTCS